MNEMNKNINNTLHQIKKLQEYKYRNDFYQKNLQKQDAFNERFGMKHKEKQDLLKKSIVGQVDNGNQKKASQDEGAVNSKFVETDPQALILLQEIQDFRKG